MMKEGILSLIAKHNLENVVSFSGLAPHCGLAFEVKKNLNYLDINSIYSSND